MNIRKISPMVRAIGTMGAVAAIVGGITFAQLTSNTAALVNNSVDSGTASLQISTDNSSWANTATGFTFSGVIPGGAASPNQTFYLENNGTTDLTLNAQINQQPTWSGGTVTNSLVYLNVTCASQSNGPTIALGYPGNDMVTLENLTGTNFTGGMINAGDRDTCTANVTMGAGAFTGSGVTENNTFNLDLTGTST
jgi:hypothetical protein